MLSKFAGLVLIVALLVSPLMVLSPVGADSSMGVVITFSGISNLNTDNSSILEIAYGTPVGSTFTVECHLVNASIANAPNGVFGAEVHVDFSSLVTGAQPVCTLVGVTDNTAALLGSGALMGIPFAVYLQDGVTEAPGPSYAGGTQVIFAGASAGGSYNGNDVMLFSLTFKVNVNWFSLNGRYPLFPINITFYAFSDPQPNPIPCYSINGVYQIQEGPPAIPAVRMDPLNLICLGNWIAGYVSLGGGYNVSNINTSSLNLNGTISVDPTAATPIGYFDKSGNTELKVEFNRTQMMSLLTSEGIAYGNVTITLTGALASGTQITCACQMQISSLPGDINCDGKVNLADLVLLAVAYGSTPASAKWNPNADMIGNGRIGLLDLVILATHYGQHSP
jgi:hypothetical protein